MSFNRPEMLYLLWFTPLFAALLVYGYRKRARILASFASPVTRLILAPTVSPGRRLLKAALILLVFPLLAVGLSGFQHGYSWQTIERQGVSLMLALDYSKSMLATDVAPSRIERAKRKIHDLTGMLQGDKVGLVAFAGTAFLQCPLTLDYSGFDLFLSALKPEDMPAQGTDLAAAVRTALAGFDLKDGSERAILLVTDGESPGADGVKAALAAAEEAAAQKTRIFCVGVGSPEGAPIPDGKGGFKKDSSGRLVHSKLDEDTLQKMAAIAGGAYVRSVAGDVDLDNIYKQRIRGGMEAKTLSSGRKQLFKDRFRWFFGLALALLLLELLIPAANRPKAKSGKGALLGLLALAALALPLAPTPALAASASSLAQEGLAAYEKQDYETALKHFLDAQIKSPEDPALAYDAANAQYRLKRFEDARNSYQTALQALEKQGKAAPAELASLKPKTLYNLGNAHFRLNQLPEAAKSYEQTLKLDPNDEDAKKNLELVKKLLQDKKEQERKEQEQPQDKKDQDKKEQDKKEQEKKDQDKKQDKQEQQSGDKQNEQKQDEQKKDDKEQGQNQQQAQQDKQEKQDKQDKGQDGQQAPQPEQNQADQNQGQSPEQQKFESSINASDLEKQGAANEDKAENGERPQGAAAGKEPAPGEGAGASQAMDQNMLNRLKDRPGMAAMPKYQPRKVEKDW